MAVAVYSAEEEECAGTITTPLEEEGAPATLTPLQQVTSVVHSITEGGGSVVLVVLMAMLE